VGKEVIEWSRCTHDEIRQIANCILIESWTLHPAPGNSVALEMPKRFAVEMLCDWIGAGKAIKGAQANTPAWYQKNKEKIMLHPKTREWVEYAMITLAFQRHQIG
jgi:hypothetical protein